MERGERGGGRGEERREERRERREGRRKQEVWIDVGGSSCLSEHCHTAVSNPGRAEQKHVVMFRELEKPSHRCANTPLWAEETGTRLQFPNHDPRCRSNLVHIGGFADISCSACVALQQSGGQSVRSAQKDESSTTVSQ